MLGYSEKKIAAKAEKRGISVEDYKAYLIKKHTTRPARRAAAREAAKQVKS